MSLVTIINLAQFTWQKGVGRSQTDAGGVDEKTAKARPLTKIGTQFIIVFSSGN